MKRRVAGLPPISVDVFNQKVLDRRTETAVMSSTKGSLCEVCRYAVLFFCLGTPYLFSASSKVYTTENAYRSHIQSKKHKENELKANIKPPVQQTPASGDDGSVPLVPKTSAPTETIAEREAKTPLVMDAEASEDEVMKTIDEKIAAARSRLSEKHCLFCNEQAPSLEDNLTHMSTTHSFFIPDAEYLVDIPGLVAYL